MKNAILFLLALASASTQMQAQILVNDYPKDISCEINFTSEIPPVTALSSCGIVESKKKDKLFSGGCLGTLVRTFTFTDTCGNSVIAEQFIRLTDKEEPTLIGMPEDVQLKDNNIPEPAKVAAKDNNGKFPEVVFTEERKDDVIIRTWTSEDTCGNQVRGIQRLYLPSHKNQ